jgi:hypothetical protein
LRQGLHVIASSWDYHGGAESRVSVRGNSGRFTLGRRTAARAKAGLCSPRRRIGELAFEP